MRAQSAAEAEVESMSSHATTTPNVDESRPLLSHHHGTGRLSASKPTESHNIADGGSRAWLAVFGSWCASFCTFGWINTIGEFQRYYQSELLRDYTSSQIAWITSLQVFFMMSMSPVFGILYDRFGPRHLLLAGTFLHTFGLMMLSVSRTYFQILIWQGVCSAIGVSAILQPSINVISGWFQNRRGAAFGVLATGSSFGGVVFPLLINRTRAYAGFGWAMRLCALLILALMLIAFLTIKAARPPSPRPVSLKQFCSPLAETRFLCLLSGLFFFTFGFYIPMNYIPSEAASGGMPASWASYLLPVLNGASFCGRLGSGWVADKAGRYNVFIIVCCLTGVFVLTLWTMASSTESRIAFSALFGFFSGAYVTLIPVLVHQISPPPEIGLRTGLVYLVCSIGGLTTNPIGGLILEKAGGWLGVKMFAGICCLVGTCFLMQARLLQCTHLKAIV